MHFRHWHTAFRSNNLAFDVAPNHYIHLVLYMALRMRNAISFHFNQQWVLNMAFFRAAYELWHMNYLHVVAHVQSMTETFIMCRLS